jgi:hypothetical protein
MFYENQELSRIFYYQELLVCDGHACSRTRENRMISDRDEPVYTLQCTLLLVIL